MFCIIKVHDLYLYLLHTQMLPCMTLTANKGGESKKECELKESKRE